LIGGALFVFASYLTEVENCKSAVIFGEITKFSAKACKSAVIFRNNGANQHSRCINFSNDISNQQFTKSANYRLVFMYKNKEIP